MRKKNDSQKNRLYKAEQVIALGVNRHTFFLADLAACQVFVDKITGTRFWKSLMKTLKVPEYYWKVEVRPKHQGHANGDHGYIRLPKRMMEDWIILHELAHSATYRWRPWHGRMFAKVYLLLVQRFMGPYEYKLLKESFKTHRVKYIKRAKRTLTEEQKVVLRERLAVARMIVADRREQIALRREFDNGIAADCNQRQ